MGDSELDGNLPLDILGNRIWPQGGILQVLLEGNRGKGSDFADVTVDRRQPDSLRSRKAFLACQ
jgi:hypothetical protein